MKFSISSGDLVQHLQVVSKVINSASVSNVPVLKNILFEIEDGKLTVTGADLNMRVSSSLEMPDASLKASFIAPSDILIDALKELPDHSIEIVVEEDNDYHATINYSNGHFDFLAGSSETFPEPLEMKKGKETLVVDAQDFFTGLNSTLFAASTDERRPIMTGVLLDILEDKMVYVASDGRILMRYTNESLKSEQVKQITLPAKLSQLLSRNILPKAKGELKLYVDEKHILIEVEGSIITARLLDGVYPKYNSVIPTDSPFKVNVNKSDLLSALKRVSLFSNKGSKLVILDISSEEIKITANDLELAVAGEETISCEREGADANLRIGLNFEMLQQILSRYEGDEITFVLKDRTAPALIVPKEADEHKKLLGLIMPLRIMGE